MEAGTTLPPPPFWAGGPAPGQVHDPIAPGPAAGVQALTRTLAEEGLNALPELRSLHGPLGSGVLSISLLSTGGSRFEWFCAAFGSFTPCRVLVESSLWGVCGRVPVIDEELLGDGHSYSPKAIHSWLTRVMYNRRSKINPLWNTVVIGGFYNGESFLGYVDMLGVAYEAPTLATGYGAYLAQPLMREVLEKKPNLTQEEARDLIERCMKILYYRDARSFNRYEIAIATEKGVEVEGPLTLEANWDIAHLVR
uniref:Proteasome subunit beta type-4 n=1 Tax=Amazona collaria TaxID=241587 RepID=A0A8B9G6I1_9PSIT